MAPDCNTNNRQTSNISHTSVDDKIVYHLDVIGASPSIGASPDGAAQLHLHS